MLSQLNDRDDLWRVLMVLMARTALRRTRDELRLQRSGGMARKNGAEEARVDERLSAEPTQEFAAQVAEEFQRLLTLLTSLPYLQLLLPSWRADASDPRPGKCCSELPAPS